jgi:septum formation protein
MMHALTIGRPLILASASPRRRELLGLLGLVFGARAARIAETPGADESAVEAVQRLAREKAAAIARQIHPRNCPVVIGADTIVVVDGDPLGKPRDQIEAENTLRRLRGREHEVYTALSLITRPDGESLDCLVRTTVPMRNYSDEEIYLYVRSGDPFDKAGAYAIQSPGFRPVADLNGCYANVMGLPLCHLAVQLGRLGVEPRVDIADACQRKTGYTCSEYPRILEPLTHHLPHWRSPLARDPTPARARPGIKTGASE